MVENGQSGLYIVVEAVAEVEAEAVVADGVVIAVRASGRVGAVEAIGLFGTGVETEACRTAASRKAGAALPGRTAAIGQAHARLNAFAMAAAGEDLDDPPDRFGAIENRIGPTRHLDPLDLLDTEHFQRCGARAGDVDPLPVQQDQRLRGFSAAHIETGDTAASAGLANLHAGHPAQQIADRAGIQTVDVVPSKDGG